MVGNEREWVKSSIVRAVLHYDTKGLLPSIFYCETSARVEWSWGVVNAGAARYSSVDILHGSHWTSSLALYVYFIRPIPLEYNAGGREGVVYASVWHGYNGTTGCHRDAPLSVQSH